MLPKPQAILRWPRIFRQRAKQLGAAAITGARRATQTPEAKAAEAEGIKHLGAKEYHARQKDLKQMAQNKGPLAVKPPAGTAFQKMTPERQKQLESLLAYRAAKQKAKAAAKPVEAPKSKLTASVLEAGMKAILAGKAFQYGGKTYGGTPKTYQGTPPIGKPIGGKPGGPTASFTKQTTQQYIAEKQKAKTLEGGPGKSSGAIATGKATPTTVAAATPQNVTAPAKAKEYQPQYDKEGYITGKSQPDAKDTKRIEDMVKGSIEGQNLNRTKLNQKATNMAKSITSADKAYRRAMAAEAENYHDVAKIFYDRANALARG
jgi:hypothetical protein